MDERTVLKPNLLRLVCWTLTWILAHSYFRLRVHGRNHVPGKGGFIIAANHVSALDPPLAGVCIYRKSFFLARESLFRGFLHFLLPRIGAFPIRRGAADRKAIRFAVRCLQEGKPVTMFPEGTRSFDGRLQPLQGGVAMIARMAGVPILPLYFAGAHRLLRRGSRFPKQGRIDAFFGPIIPMLEPQPGVSEREMDEKLQDSIYRALLALEEDAERRGLLDPIREKSSVGPNSA